MTWVFAILALVCEIIGTVGGFGSSVFFVPLASFFYDFKTVLGLTALLHVFSNLAKIILFFRHINKRLFLIYAIPSIIAVTIGAVLVTRMNLKYAEIAMSIFLILFSLFFFINRNLKLMPTNANAVAGGSIAGFAAGLLGTGGAIRGASMAAFNLEKNVFVGTSAAIDMGVDLCRSVIYLDSGFVQVKYLYLIAILVAVSFVGTYLGKLILNRINQEQFKMTVLILIILIGLITLIKVLKSWNG
ncbi:MAG: sulfite exporter TauE/SafE family protein [Bacteroidetes bacterium]|nr:sulfite exporter TauE/SafE family protein [Bacteroidota bacterium]